MPRVCVALAIYDPFLNMQFDDQHCFLCGLGLDEGLRSDEHVFPKWLQERYGLWNKTIRLINGTHIPYRQLVIPCCANCNTGPLSALERKIEAAVAQGHKVFSQLDELAVFQWLSKIHYGLVFKELLLKQDRASLASDTILTKEDLEYYRSVHNFLQSVWVPMEFVGFKPWSLFMFRLHPPRSPMLAFNYRDSITSTVVSAELDEIGIIICMQDNGTQRDWFGSYMERHQDRPLVRPQFYELVAMVLYKAGLMNRTPKYVSAYAEGSGPVTVISPSLQGFSTAPIYDEWDSQVYARILAHFWGLPFESVYKDGKVLSLLEDETGKPKYLSPEWEQNLLGF